MNIDLPTEQHTFIQRLVANGRFPSADDAIIEGVRLLMSREHLKQEVALGIDHADAGKLVDHDTVFEQLRAKARCAANTAERGQ